MASNHFQHELVVDMSSKIGDIFRRNSAIEDFRKFVMKLNGDFTLGKDDMADLGSAYLEIYPEYVLNNLFLLT